MKTSVLILIVFFTVIFGSCKEKEDTGPDLTSQLTGQYKIDYLIINQDNSKVISEAKMDTTSGTLSFSRKSNNTLIVQINIKDANTEVNESFEAVVIEDTDKSDRFGRPGLLDNYRLVYKNLNKSKEFNSGISLYKSGNVIGGLAYARGNDFISVGFGY